MSVAVVARGLRKSYRDGSRTTEVLRGVDLTVAAGEMVAVVGQSGSGKSTLLNLLGALDRPDAGAVSVAGAQLGGLSRRELADFRNRTLGFVFQFHQLLPDFSALENVMMPGRIAGRPAAALRAHALELLSEVGLAERAQAFPNQLSGGERQRVALCRAVSLRPPLLLADEPTGNLDAESGGVVLDVLVGLRAKLGITSILVTHNQAVADRCGTVLELKGGLVRDATPR